MESLLAFHVTKSYWDFGILDLILGIIPHKAIWIPVLSSHLSPFYNLHLHIYNIYSSRCSALFIDKPDCNEYLASTLQSIMVCSNMLSFHTFCSVTFTYWFNDLSLLLVYSYVLVFSNDCFWIGKVYKRRFTEKVRAFCKRELHTRAVISFRL